MKENDALIQNVANLSIFPKSLNDIKNLVGNIEAIQYLEYWSGVLHGRLYNDKDFIDLKNEVKVCVFNNNMEKIFKLYKGLFCRRNLTQKERVLNNTIFMVIMYQANKELGSYNLN